MRQSRTIAILFLLCVAGLASGQGWSEAYIGALNAAKAQQWSEARMRFQQAASLRAEDSSGATRLPGPATEQRSWRNGAPYSPNFGAAYSALKAGLASRDEEERRNLLAASISEFETLLSKGQASRATFYFLNAAYAVTRNTEGQRRVETAYLQLGGRANWKVDLEIILPEEVAAIDNATGRPSDPGRQQPTTPNLTTPPPTTPPVMEPPRQGGSPTGTPQTPPATWHAPLLPNPLLPTTNMGGGDSGQPSLGGGTLVGRVPQMSSKFALVVGNAESKLPNGEVKHAITDATIIRDALVLNGGYPEANVELINNATAEDLRNIIASIAERLGENSVVTIFFTGVGVNLDGKDYLVGVDAASPTDVTAMTAKTELYAPLMAKGARIFAFYQCPRPIVNGRIFGTESPLAGSIAQVQGTVPGGSIYSIVREGQSVGLFAEAVSRVLQQFRTNRIPITDFVWDVFYAMRTGGTGTGSGSSRQTPTLPVLTNMANDARF